MNRRLFLSGLLLAVLGFLGGCTPPPYTNIDNDQLKALLQQGVPLYDVRRPEEWRETGVVAGSRLLTFVDARGQLLPDFLPRLTAAAGKNEPIILICRTGSRTDVLARHLIEQMGYTQVYNVEHGISRWIRDKQPITKTEIRPTPP